MTVPTNGRVVIVDDKLEDEALPLIQALGKRGIPVRYYTGRASSLPDIPLNGVRLMILDLMLEGMDFTTDSVDINRALKAVIDRLIDSKNGPYVILGWTRTPKKLEGLIEVLETKPITYLDMEKSDCLSNGSDIVEKIEAKLAERMQQLGHFQNLLMWENLLNDCAYLTLNQITEAAPDSKSLEALMRAVSEANLGEHIESSAPEKKIKGAFQVFNELLADNIESKVQAAKLPFLEDLVAEYSRDNKSLAKLNTKLLLSRYDEANPYPGNVYMEKDKEVMGMVAQFMVKLTKDKLVKDAKKAVGKIVASRKVSPEEKEMMVQSKAAELEKTIIAACPIVSLEITPVCDYVQGNMKYHRLLSGFLLNWNFDPFLPTKLNDIGFYKSNMFFVEKLEDCFRLILDFRSLRTISLGTLDNVEPLLRLQRDVLFDIQHKAGTHFSRPGIVSITL